MADSTVSDLETMKETPVSGLPGAIEIYDNALFLLEHNGVAYRVTGAQLKSYAVAAAQSVNKGADGITPHIGNNGNWFIGDVDAGVKAAGTNGQTPYIGTNNHWWIGETDTGVVAVGQDGNDGETPYIGANGHWFVGDTDTGVAAQGPSGSGTGDMLASVYDPKGKAQDVFKYVDDLLDGKQNKITGEVGQFVVIGGDGNATAMTIPIAEEESV